MPVACLPDRTDLPHRVEFEDQTVEDKDLAASGLSSSSACQESSTACSRAREDVHPQDDVVRHCVLSSRVDTRELKKEHGESLRVLAKF